MTMRRQTDRAFGLMFAAVFTVITIVAWLGFDTRLYWALGTAAVFLLISLAAPGLLMPLNRLWAAFAARLGHVSNHVILGAFFYLFVLPAGLIIRLLGRDPLHRSFDDKARSYWTPVGRQANRDTFPDMF